MPYATQTATNRNIVFVPLTYSDNMGPPAGGCSTSSINTWGILQDTKGKWHQQDTTKGAVSNWLEGGRRPTAA
jgi:hypothetical protein